MKALIQQVFIGLTSIVLCLVVVQASAQTPDQVAGDRYYDQKNYKKAADHYGKVLKTDSNNVQVLRKMGFSMMNLKNSRITSAVYFGRLVKIDSADASANYYLGLVYKEAAKQPDARNEKANFKALSQTYLKKAAALGYREANVALKELGEI